MTIQIGRNILQNIDNEQEIPDSFNKSFDSNETTDQLDVDYTDDLTSQDSLQFNEELLKDVEQPSITEDKKHYQFANFQIIGSESFLFFTKSKGKNW